MYYILLIALLFILILLYRKIKKEIKQPKLAYTIWKCEEKKMLAFEIKNMFSVPLDSVSFTSKNNPNVIVEIRDIPALTTITETRQFDIDQLNDSFRIKDIRFNKKALLECLKKIF